jgi:hypothetical protein
MTGLSRINYTDTHGGHPGSDAMAAEAMRQAIERRQLETGGNAVQGVPCVTQIIYFPPIPWPWRVPLCH